MLPLPNLSSDTEGTCTENHLIHPLFELVFLSLMALFLWTQSWSPRIGSADLVAKRQDAGRVGTLHCDKPGRER